MSDFNPDAFIAQASQPQAATPAAPQQPMQQAAAPDTSGFDPDSFIEDAQQEKYGTPGQQAITALEGIGQGLAGPVATGAERLMGVKPEDIRGREEANPYISGGSKALGLGASLFTGVGEGAIAAKAGEAAMQAAKIGEEGSALANIAGHAVDQATQMAILQGGDEVSKMLVNDPDASAQNAIGHMGLAAAIGGIGGAALGSISPLWKATVGERLSKPLEDMKARWKFRVENPNPIEAAREELQNVHGNISDVRNALYSEGESGGGVKADMIGRALPELNEKSTKVINDQIQGISDNLSSEIERMQKNAKVSGKAKILEQDLLDFQDKVTQPNASYQDQFNAVDELKKTLQGYSNYKLNAEDSAFGAITKKLAGEIRPMLEDEGVWGKAAGVQKDINSAFKKFIDSEKDMTGKFTTKLTGERIIDPGKIETYLRQAGNPKAEIKQEVLKRYLDSSEKLIDTVNKAFTSRGLEPQFAHTSTNVLSDSLGKKTAGAKIIDQLIDKEIDKVGGKVAGGSVGSAIGGAFGHPGIGFLLGEHTLGPAFSSVIQGLTKTISEKPALTNAFKSAVDFSIAAAKGQKQLVKATSNVLKPGVQVLSSSMMVSDKDRDRLDRVVAHIQDNPQNIAKIDHGQLGHYMPGHQVSLSESSVNAANYLASLKPKPHILGPLDKPVPPQPAEIARYNRALDIAQSPGIVLERIKNGTLQPSDIQDLHTMYPALYKQMSTQLTNEMTNMKADGEPIPYKTRMGISLFLGQPMDVSMQPMSIMAAQPLPKAPNSPVAGSSPKKGTSTLGKTNKSYNTPVQASERDRSDRS